MTLRDWEIGLSYEEWAKIIAQKIKESDDKDIVICSDAVGSPYVEAFDFQWINDLPENRNITVVVDASHILGIQSLNHSIIQSLNHSIIVTASLNKALAMPGGVIFSTIIFVQSA